MTFTDFIEQAWQDHGDNAVSVADRLAESTAMISSADDLERYANLTTHVYGEHLGRWQQGIVLLESLRALPVWNAGDTAVAGGIAVLKYCGDDVALPVSLNAAARIAILATAASALISQHNFERALDAYATAVELASDGLPEGSPAFRALAVGGNNLAAELERKPERTPSETAGMVMAARHALHYWKIAGTWLNEERAEYRLARSLLRAGATAEATQSAQRCLDVCARNNAPPVELFFAHASLALAHHAAGNAHLAHNARVTALACYADVTPQEQQWCTDDLRELSALSPVAQQST